MLDDKYVRNYLSNLFGIPAMNTSTHLMRDEHNNIIDRIYIRLTWIARISDGVSGWYIVVVHTNKWCKGLFLTPETIKKIESAAWQVEEWFLSPEMPRKNEQSTLTNIATPVNLIDWDDPVKIALKNVNLISEDDSSVLGDAPLSFRIDIYTFNLISNLSFQASFDPDPTIIALREAIRTASCDLVNLHDDDDMRRAMGRWYK